MRIAYTCQDISISGGLERILVDKANAMAEAGHDVCLIVNNPPGNSPAYAVSPRVHFVDIGLRQPRGLKERILFKFRQNAAISKALRRFRPEVRVAVPSWLTLSILAGPGKLLLESHSYRPFVFDMEKRSLYKRFKVAVAERLASVVVALTHEDSAEWRAAHRVEVIPNFSNIRDGGADGDHTAGAVAVSRLDSKKQIDLLIDVWKIVTAKYPGATLDIYGDGPDRALLQAQIDSLGLGCNVRLAGVTSDVVSAYRAHSFLMLSSRNEGFPLVLIEAMQCGCPCVAVDCQTGPREIIRSGEDGLVVESRGLSRDAIAANLAEGAMRLFANPPERARMGAAARENVKRFSRERILRRWDELFRSI